MPQILGLALIGAGLYAGYRAVTRLADELMAERRRRADEAPAPAEAPLEKDLGALVRDPETGVYRPERR